MKLPQLHIRDLFQWLYQRHLAKRRAKKTLIAAKPPLFTSSTRIIGSEPERFVVEIVYNICRFPQTPMCRAWYSVGEYGFIRQLIGAEVEQYGVQTWM